MGWACGQNGRRSRPEESCVGQTTGPENYAGRPRLRWADLIKRDLQLLDVQDPNEWWIIAQDRLRWKHLVVTAKHHQGLLPPELVRVRDVFP